MKLFFFSFTFECSFPFETFSCQTFAFMELIPFNSFYEFLFFSSVSLKLSDNIQILVFILLFR